MSEEDYHPYYLQGIEHLNVCEFCEAHEVWEALWIDYRGPARKFYQGLIQTAAGLHHFGNGNIGGAKKLYVSSRNSLEPFRPKYLGCDLERLFREMEQCFAEANATDDEFPTLELDPDLAPEIHLDPPARADWKQGYTPYQRHRDD